ncbi:DUF1127 domain-containing protein [Zavarzinia sp.]|uniref:DUF1127 domain-containing protein n=1 Tax=Zavarzinia sp. TaxID=2027920 RepID=UPI003565F292
MTDCMETNSPVLSPAAAAAETVMVVKANGRATVWGLVAKAMMTLLTWQRRLAERHHIREMDDRMLRDIGLSRADIEGEATKPFWRP